MYTQFVNNNGSLQAITMELTRSMELFLGAKLVNALGVKWYNNKG